MAISLDTPLMGPVDCTAAQIVAAIRWSPTATAYDENTITKIAESIMHWSGVFGYRTSPLASQILHETGRFRYGGQVTPDQWNFAGLGSTNDGAAGARFPNLNEGVLAVCCHRALYQFGDIPRWPEHLREYGPKAIRRDAVKSAGYLGVVTAIKDFSNGRWAWSPQYPKDTLQNGYAQAIVSGANFIRAFPTGDTPEPPKEEPPVSKAQIPGFTWHPADLSHYAPGRTAKVRGGAQHYTAGTNSLNWLSTTPGSRVSAHFLVKHNPTLEDRGWQIVRMEDTAWTTAFANPYTVSIEYEHTGKGPVPDIAYTVLAHTWRDIAAYVKRHNLGSISADASGLKGHKEWVGNPGLICPDGIDVARVIREWRALITDVESLVIAGNPYDAKLVLGFRDMFLRVGAAMYPDDPIAGGLTVFGYPMGDEYGTSSGSAQVFERVVMQYHRNTPPPFNIVASLRNEPIPEEAA